MTRSGRKRRSGTGEVLGSGASVDEQQVRGVRSGVRRSALATRTPAPSSPLMVLPTPSDRDPRGAGLRRSRRGLGCPASAGAAYAVPEPAAATGARAGGRLRRRLLVHRRDVLLAPEVDRRTGSG
ncbi:MAG: hypothetical protein MZU79_00600 [Anaerotruncus sp.]|nr:hypothetical protein [Anaerotruncus sp.]